MTLYYNEVGYIFVKRSVAVSKSELTNFLDTESYLKGS